jgi:blue copper oxidase
MTRRRLLTLGASAAALSIVRPFETFAQDPHQQHMQHGAASTQAKAQALPIPALIEPDAAGVVKLTVQKGRHAFTQGSDAASAGINGTYLGPVVRLKNGEAVTLSVNNGMDEDTTLHWHGLLFRLFLMAGRIMSLRQALAGSQRLRLASRLHSTGSTRIYTGTLRGRRIWELPG